jgi:putative ABC transport system ATP-binding protein
MNSANGIMVSAVGLTKHYPAARGERDAIHDVSLAIPAGQLWVVSGPSGSGKTTLLGLLGGMIAPTRGEVCLDGKSITHLRDHHRALVRRSLVGMAFQEFALVMGMTLIENILLPLTPQGGATHRDLSRASKLLRRFGMEDLAESRVERLSGGERQRGAIVRALILDPPLLMLDEPTAFLDTNNVHRIMELLFALRDEGRTILVATHDARLLDHRRLDGALRLMDGKLQTKP